MALPVFRAAGAKTASSTQPFTVTAPAGIATGDLEIMLAICPDANTISITTNGGGAWTPIIVAVTVTAGMRLYAWWRIRGGSDSDPAITVAGGTPYGHAVRLCYQTGTFNTTDPFEAEVTGSEATSDTSFSFAPGGSTTLNDCLVCVVSTCLVDQNSTTQIPVCTNSNLSSLTSRYNNCTNVGAGGGIGMTEGALATAGAIGTFACTYATASPKSYFAFAIKPAGLTQADGSAVGTTGGSIVGANIFNGVTAAAGLAAGAIAPAAVFTANGGSVIDYYPYSNFTNLVGVSLYTGFCREVGQSFTALAGRLKTVSANLLKAGSPTGNVFARLYAHSGTFGTSSIPTGTALATSAAVDITTIPTSGSALTAFNFSDNFQLVAGTNYVVAIGYLGGDQSNYINAAIDAVTLAHLGNASKNVFGAWTPGVVGFSNADLIFYVEAFSGVAVATGDGEDASSGVTIVEADGSSAGVASSSVSGNTIAIINRIATFGIAQVLGSGRAILFGETSSTGVGAAIANSVVIRSSTGSSVGVSTITAVSAATKGSVASSTGVGTALGSSSGSIEAVGSSTGTSTVSGAGVSIKLSVGASTNIATVFGVSGAATGSVASSTSTSQVSGVGVVTRISVASATGFGAATGTAVSIRVGVFSSTGVGTVSGVSSPTTPATASSVGTSTATAFSVNYIATTGSATGVGTATGLAQAFISSVGSSVGVGTATATSSRYFASVFFSLGTSTATAVGEDANVGIGEANADATGTSTVFGAARAIFTTVGSTAGVSSVSATSSTLNRVSVTATAAGSSTVTGFSLVYGAATAASDGLTVLTGVGVAVGLFPAVGNAAGFGLVLGIGQGFYPAFIYHLDFQDPHQTQSELVATQTSTEFEATNATSNFEATDMASELLLAA